MYLGQYIERKCTLKGFLCLYPQLDKCHTQAPSLPRSNRCNSICTRLVRLHCVTLSGSVIAEIMSPPLTQARCRLFGNQGVLVILEFSSLEYLSDNQPKPNLLVLCSYGRYSQNVYTCSNCTSNNDNININWLNVSLCFVLFFSKLSLSVYTRVMLARTVSTAKVSVVHVRQFWLFYCVRTPANMYDEKHVPFLRVFYLCLARF